MPVSSFGKTERNIARYFSKYPLIKQKIKTVYQFLSWLLNRVPYRYKTYNLLEMINTGASESFFGYYDKSPVSPNGKYILFYTTEYSTAKKPHADKTIMLALQENETKKVLLKIKVSAYNWQQGSRVHWLSDDIFIFNDYEIRNKKYIACAWSASLMCEIKRFDIPVQVSYKTEYFLSLNYKRLMALCPDYGYRNLLALEMQELVDISNDGIWKVNYDTGENFMLISLADICSVGVQCNVEHALHTVNHAMISPSGNDFIFIHRYYLDGKRFDRLLLADSITGDLKLLSNNGMVSHCFWISDKTIVAYLRDSDGKDGYNLIDVDTLAFVKIYNEELFFMGDGHPHVSGEWFVTDSYPDKSRMQHLVLVNWKTGELKKLGEFFHGLKYRGETRCDLHPRFTKDGKQIFFDSVFSGKRQLYKMDIK